MTTLVLFGNITSWQSAEPNPKVQFSLECDWVIITQDVVQIFIFIVSYYSAMANRNNTKPLI